MLLSNCNIMVTVRESLGEFDHTRTLTHGRRNSHKSVIGKRRVAKPLTKDLRVGWLRYASGFQPLSRIELSGAMVGNGIFLSTFIPPALAGNDMKKLRAFQLAKILKRRNKCIKVVTIDGPEIVKTKLLKKRAWRNKTLCAALKSPCDLKNGRHYA